MYKSSSSIEYIIHEEKSKQHNSPVPQHYHSQENQISPNTTMNPLLRSTIRFTRSTHSPPFLTRTTRLPSRPYASQSYGGEEMTGHPKSDAPNPKADLEHPGPEPPTFKSTTQQASSSSSSSSQNDTPSSTSKSESGPKSSHPTTSQGGSPAISNPGAAPENKNEDVRKHNEEMANRHDRPANQIDEDGKVGKGFWKGEF
jgi:hypothetical protein